MFVVTLQPDLDPNLNELERTWTGQVMSFLMSQHVKLQPDLEPNQNELEQTWTSRVRSWLCFPMSQQEQQEEEPHLILPYRKGLYLREGEMVGVLKVSGGCPEGVWRVSGRYLEGVWKV